MHDAPKGQKKEKGLAAGKYEGQNTPILLGREGVELKSGKRLGVSEKPQRNLRKFKKGRRKKGGCGEDLTGGRKFSPSLHVRGHNGVRSTYSHWIIANQLARGGGTHGFSKKRWLEKWRGGRGGR